MPDISGVPPVINFRKTIISLFKRACPQRLAKHGRRATAFFIQLGKIIIRKNNMFIKKYVFLRFVKHTT
jgi:hypothetical protein